MELHMPSGNIPIWPVPVYTPCFVYERAVATAVTSLSFRRSFVSVVCGSVPVLTLCEIARAFVAMVTFTVNILYSCKIYSL